MKPGRELDALVAMHIMDLEGVLPEFGCDALGKAIPHYSTDIAIAWMVDKPGWLWEFQETGITLTVTLYISPDMLQKSVRSYPVLPEETIIIRRGWLDDKARTYAWLRCLAALEAVGVEVNSD